MAKLMLTRLIVLFVLLGLVTSCGTQSPADQQAQELQTVVSWVATAHMASNAWLHDAVPSAYARHTLQTAQQSIQDSLDTLGQASAPPTMLAPVRDIGQIIGRMAGLVDQNDRTAFGQELATLATQEQNIGTIAKHAEGQQ